MSSPNTPVSGKMRVHGQHPSLLLILMMMMTLMMTSQRDVTVSAMLPYGSGTADTGHVAPSSVSLSSYFTLYGTAHSSLYVNVDGFVTFTGDQTIYAIRDDTWADLTFPIICIFCTDFVPSADHQVWTRLSTSQSDVQAIETLARQHRAFGSSFTPQWVFVVTWDDLISQYDNTGNIMQLVLARDGDTSLVLMEYNKLTWVEGFDLAAYGYPYTTKVGIGKGDGSSYYVFPESESENLFNLTDTSNIDVPGQYLFRVDQATITATPNATTITTTTPTTTTTTPAATTTTPTTTTTTPTTTTTTPTTTSSAANTDAITTAALSSSEEFNAAPYYIGFGVSGGVLLSVAVLAAVLYKTKGFRKSRSASKASSRVRVKPVPVVTDYHHDQRPPAATNGVLFLGKPFHIPRPSASLNTVFQHS